MSSGQHVDGGRGRGPCLVGAKESWIRTVRSASATGAVGIRQMLVLIVGGYVITVKRDERRFIAAVPADWLAPVTLSHTCACTWRRAIPSPRALVFSSGPHHVPRRRGTLGRRGIGGGGGHRRRVTREGPAGRRGRAGAGGRSVGAGVAGR